MTQQLQQTSTVTLSGTGAGTLVLAPVLVREHWEPTQLSVKVSTQTSEAVCQAFLGVTSAGLSLGSTGSGSTGDTLGFAGLTLVPGQGITVVWTGGDAGAIATATLVGTRGRFGGE